ncbi:MAG: MBL fold metallo-hydrolase [Deltaproteobacteria bacterium]|jgi:glyoxylase-like metal-dependent hydrolase (beta-lactamase superfamily II)|nr:MBL fold metallo-hydrolase [Deltaproteobacteria bacterium]
MKTPINDVYFYPFSSRFENNCNTVIIDGPEKLIIDPGHKHHWPKLRDQIKNDGLNPADLKLCLHTHCHPDHMEAGQILESDYGATQAMSQTEKDYFDTQGHILFTWMGLDLPQGHIGYLLEEGQLTIGNKELQLYQCPGHTPGSLVIHWPETGLLITGDVIFPASYGRTDFPGGSQEAISQSINRLSQLKELSLLLPGHGSTLKGANDIYNNFAYVSEILTF